MSENTLDREAAGRAAPSPLQNSPSGTHLHICGKRPVISCVLYYTYLLPLLTRANTYLAVQSLPVVLFVYIFEPLWDRKLSYFYCYIYHFVDFAVWLKNTIKVQMGPLYAWICRSVGFWGAHTYLQRHNQNTPLVCLHDAFQNPHWPCAPICGLHGLVKMPFPVSQGCSWNATGN